LAAPRVNPPPAAAYHKTIAAAASPAHIQPARNPPEAAGALAPLQNCRVRGADRNPLFHAILTTSGAEGRDQPQRSFDVAGNTIWERRSGKLVSSEILMMGS